MGCKVRVLVALLVVLPVVVSGQQVQMSGASVLRLLVDPLGCPTEQILKGYGPCLTPICVPRIRGTSIPIGGSVTTCPVTESFVIPRWSDTVSSNQSPILLSGVVPVGGRLLNASASVQQAPGGSNGWRATFAFGSSTASCTIIGSATSCNMPGELVGNALDYLAVLFTEIGTPQPCRGARWIGEYEAQ